MTTPSPSRRNFLRGRFHAVDANVMRPPGSVSEFAKLCTECGDCVSACPEKIIRVGEDRLPVVDFALGACTFCDSCAEACTSGALVAGQVESWIWRAEIQDNCFSLQGVMCRTCEDVCEPRAVRFKLAVGGKAEPVIDLDQCTGCGECAHSCPAQAVQFKRAQDLSAREKT